MNKVYNTQQDFATSFNNFLNNIDFNLSKNISKFLPYIIFGMIKAESSTALDIAKELKGDFSFVQYESIVKRIRRFYNNKYFNGEEFYDALISYIIQNYKKKHKDNRVHIIIDHMFSHSNYTTLMFSMRIGKQGIPIWFKSFSSALDAMQEELIIKGIKHVIELFEKFDFQITFIADRWFNSTTLMNTITDAGHIFIFRMKKNIKVLVYDKKEGHKVWKFLSELKSYKYHSILYENIQLSDNKFNCNIVISKSHGTKEPWILATNSSYKHTIKDYSYRFGGIETIFKNQKSNGFYLENISNATEHSYQNMYALVCTSLLFLTIIGADYSKNTKCYKHIRIETHKNYKSKGKVRIKSLFQTGLLLFKLATDSLIYIRIPYNFILYDI